MFGAFFTAGAKSDDPLSHPQYGATQNGLPKIRTGVQVLNSPYIWITIAIHPKLMESFFKSNVLFCLVSEFP